jgi:tRNA (Thr-GGU) A37 N-methylase
VNEAAGRWFRVRPNGYMRRSVPATFDPRTYYDPFTKATLEILPRCADARTGLEEYCDLLVIFWFDHVQRAKKSRLRIPEGREELPEVGLFATRTTRRPNSPG